MKTNYKALLIYTVMPVIVALLHVPFIYLDFSLDKWFDFYAVYTLVPLICVMGAIFTIAKKRSLLLHTVYCQLVIFAMSAVRYFYETAFGYWSTQDKIILSVIRFTVFVTVMNVIISLCGKLLAVFLQVNTGKFGVGLLLVSGAALVLYAVFPLIFFALSGLFFQEDRASLMAMFISPFGMMLVCTTHGYLCKKAGLSGHYIFILLPVLLLCSIGLEILGVAIYSSPMSVGWFDVVLSLAIFALCVGVMFISNLIPKKKLTNTEPSPTVE